MLVDLDEKFTRTATAPCRLVAAPIASVTPSSLRCISPDEHRGWRTPLELRRVSRRFPEHTLHLPHRGQQTTSRTARHGVFWLEDASVAYRLLSMASLLVDRGPPFKTDASSSLTELHVLHPLHLALAQNAMAEKHRLAGGFAARRASHGYASWCSSGRCASRRR